MVVIEDNNNQDNKNMIQDEAVKMVKTIGKTILRTIVIILLPFFVILLLLAAITWFILMDEGSWGEDEKGNPSSYTNNVTLSTTDGISIDKLELVKQGLKSMGYTEDKINSMTEADMIKALEMTKKLGRTINSINDCTVAEILWCINTEYSKYLEKPEDLEYLLNAELVTQYPKINGVASDKLNGIIEFARITSLDDTDQDGNIDLDDGPKMLTYISSDEFETKFQNYVSTGDMDVFNYYTLDDQENAVIATWSQEDGLFESNNTALQESRDKINPGFNEELVKSGYDSRYTVTEYTEDKISATYTTYTATKATINYKANVQKYTLPFNYLWALLVMGESDDFVLKLAELAYNSRIVIGVYDSTTTTVTVNTKNYTENFRENYQEHSPRENPGKPTSGWTETAYTYFEKETKTYVTNTTQIDMMYANTWIVELRAEYKRNQTHESYPNTTTTPDENWSDNGTYSRRDTRTGTRTVNGKKVEYTYTVIEVYYREKKLTGQSQQTQQDIYYDKYEKVKTDIREKTDIDPNTDQNFVKLLRADANAKTILFKPINVVWLCDILSENSNTANMVELTKYLINKAKNPDDTSLSFDFGIFGENNFNQAGGTGAQNLSTYLRQFSHSVEAPQSQDGKYYLMYSDGSDTQDGWPTIGNADLQWKSHHGSFAKEGKVLQNGTETTVANVEAYVNNILGSPDATYTKTEMESMQIYIEKELVDSIGDELQSSYYQIVLAETNGLNLSKQQLYALTEIQYNFGNIPERNGYTFKQVYEAGAAQYEVNSWEHNKFIWDNWWAYLGGMTAQGGSYGLLEARDGAFETYVKGTYDLSESIGGPIFGRTCYVFYTQSQIAMYDYARNLPFTRTTSNEEELFTYEESNGEAILAAAEELHKKYEDEDWQYYTDTSYSLIPKDVVASMNHPNKITCCATFVSGVLYMSGYAPESEMNTINIHSSNAILNFMRSRGDCTEITSYDELQAGDIVFMTSSSSGSAIGHVQICAGDNQWYNAGTTEAINRDSPYNDSSYARSHFVTAMRIN